MAGLPQVVGGAVIVAAVAGIVRGLDVRLVMAVAGLALGGLAGDVPAVVTSFLATFSSEKYVVPICTAMGFAYVLRKSGCDTHLVRLLIGPVRRVRWLLLPAAVGVGFFVNIAVVSQTSTAVAVATVMIPLMRSAGLRPAVVGSALLLGASVGGELLNPGAPELQTISENLSQQFQTKVDSRSMQPHLAPLLAVQLGVATALFWLRCGREPREEPKTRETDVAGRVNVVKALIPLVPLAVLLVTGPPHNLAHVPEAWLTNADHPGPYGPRLIGASMLLGTVLVALVSPGIFKETARSFFEGAGCALATIVAIIATADCFGTGVKRLHLADWVGDVTAANPGLVWPLAAACALGFAVVCGSGIASTGSLYRFFIQPGWTVADNLAIGAMVSIASAAGRTASPAAAVVLACASLVEVNPWELVRRVSAPLIAATAVTAAVAWWRG